MRKADRLRILDTNAVSDAMSGHPALVTALAQAGQQPVATTVISRGEILFGIASLPTGRRRRNLEAKASQVFAVLPCEPVPSAAAAHYAALKAPCRRRGLVLDENDLWIAATVLEFDAVLVTRDADFGRIPNLVVEDWTT